MREPHDRVKDQIKHNIGYSVCSAQGSTRYVRPSERRYKEIPVNPVDVP